MKSLLYGAVLDGLIFMDPERARDLATIQPLLATRSTWKSFREVAPPNILSELEARYGDTPPGDDEAFPPASIEDGDWPFLEQEQLAFLSPRVASLGKVFDSVFNGEALKIPIAVEAEVTARLRAEGYIVKRDDRLVSAAAGVE